MYEFKEKCLNDNWTATGNDMEELKDVLSAMNSVTSFVKMKTGDISLLSLIGTDHTDYVAPDGTKEENIEVIDSIYLNPVNLPSENLSLPLNANIKRFRSPSIDEGLLDEWKNKTKLALLCSNKAGAQILYFTSGSALQTMDRFKMSGEFLLTPCLERDMMIAKRFSEDLGVTAVIRSVGKIRKIFTILSDKYAHIDQEESLFKVIKQIEDAGEMGKCKCYRWEVSNFFTKLYVEFPETAEALPKLYGLSREMIPGIMITTSDTGDASFTVRGTWRAEGSNSLAVNSEVKRKHIGEIDINKIVDDITNDIFAEYAKLPEALCNLMSNDVTDTAWDLTTSAGVQANASELDKVLKTAFKRLNIVKAIGKKTEKVLRQEILDELNPSVRYTQYDIAMLIMGLPERVVFMDKGKDIALLQKACGQAPFIDYTVDKTVILTA